MNMLCDLHTHSVFSDGTYTPAQLIDSALALGLSAIALCDHNTVDGLPYFAAAAEGKGIEAICGAEFSVDYDGTELHLLGLYIPPEHFAAVSEKMSDVIRRKEKSNRALVEALRDAGYPLDYDEIKSRNPTGKINRAHVAAELVDKGCCDSMRAAFDTLLRPEAGYYIEPDRLNVWEMLDFIRSLGAAPILAHPFINIGEAELAEFLPQAKRRGLIGMECRYSLYSEQTTQKAAALARANGLKLSGGSDFHGANKPDISLGSGKGSLRVPYEWAQEIKCALM